MPHSEHLRRLAERNAVIEMAEAAQTVGRDHHEDCDCEACRFSFQLWLDCSSQIQALA